MIRTDSDLALEQEQLGRVERALESLCARVLPKNPRNFAIFAEAYVDQIDSLQDDIDAYLAHKKYNSSAPNWTQELLSKGSEAASFAAKASAALTTGDTARAGEFFAKAGRVVEAEIGNKRKQSEKHQCRLLAAGLYYQGGHYNHVASMCKKIQENLLPSALRPLLQEMRKESNTRSNVDFETEIRRRLGNLWNQRAYSRIVELLRQNPYCMHRGNLAFLRALCCERLEDYFPAAVLFADSWLLSPLAPLPPQNPKALFLTAGFAFILIHQRRLSEAARCVRYQFKHIPHALTFINASLLRYHQAMVAAELSRAELIQDQIEYCEEAWSRFLELPAPIRGDVDIRLVMTHCLQCAAFSVAQHDRILATRFCELAVGLAPDFWGPWTARGMLTYPSTSAMVDFRKAADLGDISWHPYYYLTIDSLSSEQLSETARWAELALKRKPTELPRAQLLTALGIARLGLGTSPEDVRFLFEEANQTAATDLWVQRNWEVYQSGLRQAIAPSNFERNIKPLETRDEYLARQLTVLAQKGKPIEVGQNGANPMANPEQNMKDLSLAYAMA